MDDNDKLNKNVIKLKNIFIDNIRIFYGIICFLIALSISLSIGFGNGEPYPIRFLFNDISQWLKDALEAVTPSLKYARETHAIYSENIFGFSWKNLTLNQVMFIFSWSFGFWMYIVFSDELYIFGYFWRMIIRCASLTLGIIAALYHFWLTLLILDWVYSGAVLIGHDMFKPAVSNVLWNN